MQLARFEGFALSLGENTTVDSALISKIYRFHNDKWYCIENKIIDDKQLLKTLSTIRKNKKIIGDLLVVRQHIFISPKWIV